MGKVRKLGGRSLPNCPSRKEGPRRKTGVRIARESRGKRPMRLEVTAWGTQEVGFSYTAGPGLFSLGQPGTEPNTLP